MCLKAELLLHGDPEAKKSSDWDDLPAKTKKLEAELVTLYVCKALSFLCADIFITKGLMDAYGDGSEVVDKLFRVVQTDFISPKLKKMALRALTSIAAALEDAPRNSLFYERFVTTSL